MIDVMKRLADLDTANPSRPEHKVSNDQHIPALSESAQVDECGMMPEMGDMGRPSTPASINMTAGSGDELGELIKAIATLAGQTQPAEMEPLSAMPAMGVASDDGMDMRAMIDKLNPMDDEGGEEAERETDEGAVYDNTPADPTDTNEFDAEEFAHHENPPGAAKGRGNMNNPRANTMEQITQNLFADYKNFIGESEDDDMEEGIEDRLKDLDPKNPVNIPAYKRKAASGDSASAAKNTKEEKDDWHPSKHVTDPQKKKELAPHDKDVKRSSYKDRADYLDKGGVPRSESAEMESILTLSGLRKL